MSLLNEAEALRDEVTALRHDLHRHPELGTDLPRTQGAVLDALDGLGLEIATGTGCTSVVAVLRGGAAASELAERPVVLLRGDMDALPLQEATGMEFSSEEPGRMHACGHDVHTAALVGAAKVLAAHRDELAGDIVFMFQPAEELVTGARIMIDEGVLDAAGKRADWAFGAHVAAAQFAPRTFALRTGTIMAAADWLRVDIVGHGGHGSSPHTAVDPVPAMADLITQLQVMVTRRLSAQEPVVINVGVANAGNAGNVIPERCRIEASLRSFSPEQRTRLEAEVRALVPAVCAVHGCTTELSWEPGVSPTVNDAEVTAFAHDVIADVFGADRVITMAQPLAGSEDFSEVLVEVPGTFVFYSGVPEGGDAETAPFNHAAGAWFDDVCLPDAVALYAEFATRALTYLTGRDGSARP